MKSIVIYYSLDGNTRFAANLITAQTGADSLEIETVKKYPIRTSGKYIKCGAQAIFNQKPEIKNNIPKLDTYDTIFLGMPVWAGRPAAPMVSFLSQAAFKGKKICLFVSHGGGGGENCIAILRELLQGNTVIKQIELVNPLRQSREEVQSKLLAWIK